MSEPAAAIAITTVLYILATLDIVGNSVVCAIIRRNRDMRTPMNYLLLNLAIADILYALFMAPKVIFKLTFVHHPDGVTGTVLCKLLTHAVFSWIGGASSIVTLVAIAIERYYAVMYPHGTKWKLTKRNLKVIIAGCWVFSITLNSPLFVLMRFDNRSNHCVPNQFSEWMVLAFTVMWWLGLVALSIVLMVVLYSRVVYTLWFKGNDNQLTHQQKAVIRVRKRVTLMVVTVTAIFGICWGTGLVVYMLNYVSPHNIGPIPEMISNTAIMFNSAVNPFVYALLNTQFREKMKNIICCTGSPKPKIRPTPKAQDMELTDPPRPSTE